MKRRGALSQAARRRCLILTIAAVAAANTPAWGQTPYRAAKGTISFALAGDAIVSRPLTVHSEPEHLAMVQVIQGADVAYANLEIVLQDVGRLTPMVSDRESYMFADPSIARDLARVGFDMVSLANNHALDYGWEGMRATARHLDEAGVAHAGVGENLTLAGGAGFVEHPAGRVALISTASTFEDFQAARPQRQDILATPGLNPLRYDEISVLPSERLDALREVARAMGQDPGSSGPFTFMGRRFESGARAATRTEPDRTDLDRILDAVRQARSWADWVVVATHTHESAGDRQIPADFLVQYAHEAIDAGADLFVGTGPHVLRGIEIRNGRPIFYSLGNFAFENETVLFRPSAEWQRVDLPVDAGTTDYYDDRQRTAGGYFTRDEVFWESVVALPSFREGRLVEIHLFPITLGYGTPRSQRGRPLRAGPEASRRIIERLARLSRPFGTEIRFQEGVGVVRVPASPPP